MKSWRQRWWWREHGPGIAGVLVVVVAAVVAAVVVFDPETIADRSTYDDGKALAVGVEHVFVNGTPVLLKGARTSARPGRGLKRQ